MKSKIVPKVSMFHLSSKRPILRGQIARWSRSLYKSKASHLTGGIIVLGCLTVTTSQFQPNAISWLFVSIYYNDTLITIYTCIDL